MARQLLAASLFLLSAAPALADAIDGDWCAGGRRLMINGPEITTPGGTTMQGNYARHQFSYLAPKGDDDAGAQVFLDLLSEKAMNSYHVIDGKLSEPTLWKRCQITS
jgi:hypothetical protein